MMLVTLMSYGFLQYLNCKQSKTRFETNAFEYKVFSIYNCPRLSSLQGLNSIVKASHLIFCLPPPPPPPPTRVYNEYANDETVVNIYNCNSI